MNPIKVLIAGTFQESDAYPNVKHRLRLIEKSSLYVVTRQHRTLDTKLDYRSKLRHTLGLIRLATDASLKSIAIVAAIVRDKSHDVAYLPYPATLLLWIISILPFRYRPARIVVDLFISLYDTAVIDRQLIDKDGFIAYLIFAFEKRALNVASVLIVDTPENADYYAALFSIDRSVFVDIPLSIDNQLFSQHRLESPASQGCQTHLAGRLISTKVKRTEHMLEDKLEPPPFRILYVGTFVPLHNIGLICRLVRELETSRPVEFVFVGDGQDAPVLEKHFQDSKDWPKNVTCKWDRQWQNSCQILEYIRSADLCIGLLGIDGKSQRVWPIKNYLYMACGKPLVTARTPVSERLIQNIDSDSVPFIAVDPKSFEELQSALLSSLNEPNFNHRIAETAVQFHKKFHTDEPVAAHLHKALSGQL